MAGKPKPITCKSFLIEPDGRVVPFDELTPERRKEYAEHAGNQMAKTLQNFWSQHPNEL
ncbi:MAG: hypothetical protein MJ168_05550 [Clostridia bacterium]|nr:hypothetical protein [Clostridia bacterium]